MITRQKFRHRDKYNVISSTSSYCPSYSFCSPWCPSFFLSPHSLTPSFFQQLHPFPILFIRFHLFWIPLNLSLLPSPYTWTVISHLSTPAYAFSLHVWSQKKEKIIKCYVLMTVRLCIILVNNRLDTQLFPYVFIHPYLHTRRSPTYSGIYQMP